MKRNRLGTLFVLIASLLVGAPAGFAQSGLSIRTAQPTRLTVPPNASSPITMKTLSQATCVLHAEGDNDEKHRMKLFADDEGVVRFHVNPEAESEEVTRFQVDCAANGKISIFPLELRSSSSPTAEMPAPAVEVAKEQPGTIVLPALTEDEALRLSDEELARRHYFPRPDREQAPGAFAQWLKLVTRPSKFVSSRLVTDSELSHGFFQLNSAYTPAYPSQLFSRNWSGYLLDDRSPSGGAGHTYDSVYGKWVVPAVSNQYPASRNFGSVASAYSSFWIGLDGYQTDALVQGGTEQDVLFSCTISSSWPFAVKCFLFHNYYAFTQMLPIQQGEQRIIMPDGRAFPIAPGDQILASLYFENPNGTRNPTGLMVGFDIWNATQGDYHTHVDMNRCTVFDASCVNGYTAEWIMERPSVNGVLPYLANYGIASSTETTLMYDAYAQTTNYIGAIHRVNFDGTPYGDKSREVWMVNDPPGAHNPVADVLSFPHGLNSYEIAFYWFDFY